MKAPMTPCVLRAAARSGWVDAAGSRVRLATAAVAGSRAFAADSLRLEAFPGRWNPRRALPPALEPLPEAAAAALERAGWWEPGSGEGSAGGLVVSADGGPLVAALGFARELREATATLSSSPSSSSSSSSSPAPAPAKLGPSGFLQALPSTAAGVLGILFGLTDYQATVVGGALAGIKALRHAVDLIEGGRLERVLVAVLSVVEGDLAAGLQVDGVRMAVALALEAAGRGDRDHDSSGRILPPSPGEGRGAAGVDCGLEGAGGLPEIAPAPVVLPEALPASCRRLAAVPLFLLAKELEGRPGAALERRALFVHADPFSGERGWVFVERKGSPECQ